MSVPDALVIMATCCRLLVSICLCTMQKHSSYLLIHICISGDIDGLADEISTVVANRKREEATIEVKSQGQIRFSIWVSFVEIYNEQMFDLLVPVSKKKFDRRPILLLRDDKNGNPYVKGIYLL